MVDFATLKLVGDTSGLKPIEPALDAVVAKAGRAESAVKKLGTSTTAMGAGARKAAADTKTVSTALDAIEADAQQAAIALNQTEAALNKVGMQSQVAGGAIGNLGAQVLDIGMMMQAGQNPFVLMVQQGSQVAQVLGPMGAGGAVAALKATFVSLLNPMNLAVFGVIGLTAALVPMIANFLSGADAAEKQSQALERQKSVIEGLNALIAEQTLMREMALSGAGSKEEQDALNEIVALTAERERLVKSIAGFEDRAMTSRAEEAAQQLRIVDSNIATAEAKLRTLRAGEQLNEIVLRNAEGAERMRALMDDLAGMNINGPWQAVLGSIQTAINKAAEYRAIAAQTATGGGRGAGPGGPLVGSADLAALQAGGGTIRNMPVPGAGGGGGGGGGGGRSAAATEAERQAQAIEKVVAGLRREIEAVGATTEARRLQQELQRAGVSIYSQEGQQIATLVEQLTELDAQQKLVAETMRGIESAAQGFFVGVLSGAKDLKSAIGDLLGELGKLFLNQAFKMLFSGGGGIGGGGLGGFLEGLFMDSGGRIQSGQIGIVAEKRPEFVDGKLVTRPTLIEGPANVTGGAATARLMAAPAMQVAQRRSPAMQMPAPRVTVQPAQVVVLDLSLIHI